MPRCLLLLLLAVALPAPVAAQLFEVDGDGTLQRLAGIHAPAVGAMAPEAPALETPAIAAPAKLQPLFVAAAERYAISVSLLHSIAARESGFRQASVSPAGAIGIMQLMPATARALGRNPHDLADNILGGAAYLRQLLDRFDGDIERAIAAYNAGPAAVSHYGGVPPFAETRRYLARNLDGLAAASLATMGVHP
jgi:soluble lytic murein transglycosylase-like protein